MIGSLIQAGPILDDLPPFSKGINGRDLEMLHTLKTFTPPIYNCTPLSKQVSLFRENDTLTGKGKCHLGKECEPSIIGTPPKEKARAAFQSHLVFSFCLLGHKRLAPRVVGRWLPGLAGLIGQPGFMRLRWG